MRVLEIDRDRFVVKAFGRDLSGRKRFEYDQVYLDCETGEVLCVFDDDENEEMLPYAPKRIKENSMRKWKIKSSPDRYLEIPGRSYREQQRILEEFLQSDWTQVESLKERALTAYNGSINLWKRLIDDGYVREQFRKFKLQKLTEMAEDYLYEHGIQADWK